MDPSAKGDFLYDKSQYTTHPSKPCPQHIPSHLQFPIHFLIPSTKKLALLKRNADSELELKPNWKEKTRTQNCLALHFGNGVGLDQYREIWSEKIRFIICDHIYAHSRLHNTERITQIINKKPYQKTTKKENTAIFQTNVWGLTPSVPNTKLKAGA